MTPPLLPPRWHSSYVSYWAPMRPGDRVTGGYAWFDYVRGVSRIDGFLNPWDEAAAGDRRWVSEINWFRRGVVQRLQIGYAPGPDDGLAARAAPPLEGPSPGPALPRDLIASADARPGAAIELHGREARPWSCTHAGRPITLYLCARTGLPLRLCVEKAPAHVSCRDFVTVAGGPIDPAVFRRRGRRPA